MALTTASQALQQPLQHSTKLNRGAQKSTDKKHSTVTRVAINGFKYSQQNNC